MSDQVFAGTQNDYYYLSSRGVNQIYFNPQTTTPLIPTGKDGLYVDSNHNLIFDNRFVSTNTSSGITNYVSTSGSLTNVSAVMSWAPSLITANPPIVSLLGNTSFAANQDGVYSFNFMFQIQPSATPTTVDMEPVFIVTVNSLASGTYTASEFLIRLVAYGSGSGSPFRRITIPATVYLASGDSVSITGQELTTGTIDTIISGGVVIASS